jgi:hypothetical protein
VRRDGEHLTGLRPEEDDMDGWAIFGVVCAVIIVVAVVVAVLANIPDLLRYLKIKSM